MTAMPFVVCVIAGAFAGAAAAAAAAAAEATELAPSDLRSAGVPVRRQRKSSVEHRATNLDVETVVSDRSKRETLKKLQSPPGTASVRESDDMIDGSIFRSAGYSRNCMQRARDFPFANLSNWKPGPSMATAGQNVTRWAALPQPTLPFQKRPKLAILMFIKDSINHEYMWHKWMGEAKAKDQDFAFHIHAKERGTSALGFLDEFVAEKSMPTSWCNIYKAEQHLIGLALKDEAVSHVAIVSADSIPIKPLENIHEELKADASSRMCMDMQGIGQGPRAETWFAMRREDAQLFHENQDLASSLRARGCTEEEAWLEPLLLRQKTNGPPVRNECVMMTDWYQSCKNWAHNVDNVTLDHLRSEPSTQASVGHPRRYDHVSSESWAELQRSGFWFGRKFSAGSFDDLFPAPKG